MAFTREQAVGEVACDVAEVTRRILRGAVGTVPAKLYHFGERKFLLADSRAGTIPREVWDDTFMGDKNRRFPLDQIRRGLYGTHLIDTNHFFSGEKYDWIMEIEVTEACRRPEKVVSLSDLPGDDRFRRWIQTRGASLGTTLDDFARSCPASGNIAHVFPGEACEKIVEAFLRDADIKVIQDHFVQKSFYVRDRACIAGLKAEPADVIRFFASTPSFWIQTCDPAETEEKFRTWKLLFRLLSREDLGAVPEETFADLLANSRLLDAGGAGTQPVMTAVIGSFLQARRAGRAADWQAAMASFDASSPLLAGLPIEAIRRLAR